MEKAIFFESHEGRLHRCIFAGLDHDGCPQWVMVDQGDEMMTLQEYVEVNCMESEDMRVLCLDGEALESMTMALLLGAVLQSYPSNIKEALAESLKTLRSIGLNWKQEKLNLRVQIYKYYDSESCTEAYRFCMSCNPFGFIAEMDNFLTMKKVMETLRCYFDTLESGAGIGLRKELRTWGDELVAELDDNDAMMFDKIV